MNSPEIGCDRLMSITAYVIQGRSSTQFVLVEGALNSPEKGQDVGSEWMLDGDAEHGTQYKRP